MPGRTIRAIAKSTSKHVMFLVSGYVLILGIMLTIGGV